MKKWILLPLLCLFAAGCDQFTWFQSEGSVRKKLGGTWKRQFLNVADYREYWIFSDGKLTIAMQKDPNPIDTLDIGSYDVSTSLFSAFVKINELTDTTYHDLDDNSRLLDYNRKWTIIDLDGKILFMVADIEAGLIQREYIKQ